MHCIHCGAAVPDNATFCPSCGKPPFVDAGSPTSAATPPAAIKPAKKGNRLLGCVGIGVLTIIILIVIGSFAGTKVSDTSTSSGNSGSAAISEPVSKGDLPLAVTATELFNAFQNNEASAQGYFGKRKLFVSGTVHKVSLDFMDNPVVELVTPNQFMSVQAALAGDSKEAGSTFNGGDKAHLLCEDVSEVASIPMLKECRPAPADTKTQKVQWSK